MVIRLRRLGLRLRLGTLLALAAVPACFDVPMADPGTGQYLIDDFEDGDGVPSTPLFRRWRCYMFNPDLRMDPQQDATCDPEPLPGDGSAYAAVVRFSLHDIKADGPDFPGVGLAVFVDDNPSVDIRGYSYLSFDMKVEIANPRPSMISADVQVGCNSVKGTRNDGVQSFFDLFQPVTDSDTWQNHRLRLSNFYQRQDQTDFFADGPSSCLAVVDSIRFEIVGNFTFGQTTSGALHIDNVRLE